MVPPRSSASRPCFLYHALVSIDGQLNQYWGPYPVFVLLASDAAESGRADMVYTAEDQQRLRAAMIFTNVTFVSIPMFSGTALGPSSQEQVAACLRSPYADVRPPVGTQCAIARL